MDYTPCLRLTTCSQSADLPRHLGRLLGRSKNHLRICLIVSGSYVPLQEGGASAGVAEVIPAWMTVKMRFNSASARELVGNSTWKKISWMLYFRIAGKKNRQWR